MSNIAIRVSRTDGNYQVRLQAIPAPVLAQGEVALRVHYSSLNYKDALTLTGKGKIVRKFPLTAGIDLAGEITDSNGTEWQRGQQVLVTGCGLGEEIDGGYCQTAHVPSKHLVPLPAGLTLKQAMAIGTAGFTAALCLVRMEANKQRPEQGALVINGASGGVGMVAVNIFSQLGYQVLAVSGKEQCHPLLKKLGAQEIFPPAFLQTDDAPMHSMRFGGAIDNLGGEYLTTLLKSTALWGNVASVGMAASTTLTSNVFPHILRGVSLLGISSNNCPLPLRRKIWQRLASDLFPRQLTAITTHEISLSQLQQQAERMIARETIGRTLVVVS